MKGIIKWDSVKQNDYDHYGQFIDFWNVTSNSVEIKLHKIISWKSSVIISVQHADTRTFHHFTCKLCILSRASVVDNNRGSWEDNISITFYSLICETVQFLWTNITSYHSPIKREM
jgi:hypothetical protein